MIRLDLLKALAREPLGLRGKEIECVVDVFFDEIGKRLSDDGKVVLRGFGTFSTRKRDARQGLNPRTGVAVEVQAKRILHFKPGKQMRARLNED